MGQLETTTAAQRPPSFIQTNARNKGSFLDWTIGNYGREAAVFLNWATGINKWVTLLDNWKKLRPRSGCLLFLFKQLQLIMGLFWIGQLETTVAQRPPY